MPCGNERERTIWQFCYHKKQMNVSFSCVCPVIRCQSSLSCGGAFDYFDNVMTKFMINCRTDAWKTDVNLLICTWKLLVKSQNQSWRQESTSWAPNDVRRVQNVDPQSGPRWTHIWTPSGPPLGPSFGLPGPPSGPPFFLLLSFFPFLSFFLISEVQKKCEEWNIFF